MTLSYDGRRRFYLDDLFEGNMITSGAEVDDYPPKTRSLLVYVVP